MIRTAEIAVFVTRRDGREVLLVHRSPVQGGYWHVVAGGVESGETASQAAERELVEETGLVARVSAGVEVTEHIDAGVGIDMPITCFRVAAPDDWEPALDWEHDGHRWCSPTEAFEALRWPATARALRRLSIEPESAQHTKVTQRG